MHILRPVPATTGRRHFDKGTPKAGIFRKVVAEQLEHKSRVCSAFPSVNHAREGV